MIIMKERKESEKKLSAIEKYTLEVLKNATLNLNKTKDNDCKNENIYKDILKETNNMNYSRW